jgi:prefoldin beta subunit
VKKVLLFAQHQEFSLIKDDSNIFKLIGPVLVKQDRAEADSNVKKRIEFISAEIKKFEGLIKDFEEKSEKKKIEIVKLQSIIEEAKKASVKV